MTADDPGAVPVPEAVRRERIERLRVAARARDLAAVVVFSYGSRSGAGTHGHLRYLLDWTSGGGCAMLLLPVDGPPAVVVPAPFDPPWMRELCPWIEDVYLEGAGNQPRVARTLLDRRGIRGRIGLVGVQALPPAAYREMLAPDPRWELEAVDELLHRQRTVKDEIALARLRRAAAICDTMFEALVEALRVPGMPVWKAQATMQAVAELEGAESVTGWMSAGREPDRTRTRREENLAPLRPGDRVTASIIMIYAGYYGHALRMFTIGDPTPAHERVWRAVSEAQSAAAGRLRPGENARLITPTAEEVLFRHFPGAREGDRRRFQVAHFTGLDYAEYPTGIVGRAPGHDRFFAGPAPDLQDFPLEAGMTIELHPNVWVPGLGFGAVGDVFLVTPAGAERLNRFPTGLQAVTPR
jgi:Xaa-Pro aminopeptidase